MSLTNCFFESKNDKPKCLDINSNSIITSVDSGIAMEPCIEIYNNTNENINDFERYIYFDSNSKIVIIDTDYNKNGTIEERKKYFYNELDSVSLINKYSGPNGPLVLRHEYTYDELGRMIESKTSNPMDSNDYDYSIGTYDSLGNKIAHEYGTSEDSTVHIIIFSFNSNSLLQKIGKIVSPNMTDTNWASFYFYDPEGNITRIEGESTHTDFNYDDFGNLIFTKTNYENRDTRYHYDKYGRQELLQSCKDGNLEYEISYQYDCDTVY